MDTTRLKISVWKRATIIALPLTILTRLSAFINYSNNPNMHFSGLTLGSLINFSFWWTLAAIGLFVWDFAEEGGWAGGLIIFSSVFFVLILCLISASLA